MMKLIIMMMNSKKLMMKILPARTFRDDSLSVWPMTRVGRARGFGPFCNARARIFFEKVSFCVTFLWHQSRISCDRIRQNRFRFHQTYLWTWLPALMSLFPNDLGSIWPNRLKITERSARFRVTILWQQLRPFRIGIFQNRLGFSQSIMWTWLPAVLSSIWALQIAQVHILRNEFCSLGHSVICVTLFWIPRLIWRYRLP